MMRFLIAFVMIAATALAQVPRENVEISVADNGVTIEYGRPSLKGRDILTEAPVGTVWRLGADEATTMTIAKAAVFGNMVAQAGSYSLFVQRAEETQWVLLVNEQTGQWGTEHDPGKDLMAIPLNWEQQQESTEELTIELALTPKKREMAQLAIRWGTHVLSLNFRVPAMR